LINNDAAIVHIVIAINASSTRHDVGFAKMGASVYAPKSRQLNQSADAVMAPAEK
jgi:hypothetical protein